MSKKKKCLNHNLLTLLFEHKPISKVVATKMNNVKMIVDLEVIF